MVVVGIDPGMNCLGYAVYDHGEEQTGVIKSGGRRGADRLVYMRECVRSVVTSAGPAVVAYEGYAMGRQKNQRPYDTGEFGGVIKTMLWEEGYTLLLVPPASLKIFATSTGNADKDAMRVAMAKLRGSFFASDDEADAYGLMRMGLAHLSARHRHRDPRHYTHRGLRGCELVPGDGCGG